jgi:DNA-binding beta-propeller fold protein YncE
VVYVTDTGNDRVIALSSGAGCEAFVVGEEGDGEGEFDGPRGIALLPSGAFIVADTGNDRLQRFGGIAGLNPGDPISFDNIFAGGEFGVPLDEPHGLGVDDDGRLYVADTGNGRVVRLDEFGALVDTIGTADDGGDLDPGEMMEPVDVAVCPSDAVDASAGRIYVADRGADLVHVFEADGSFAFRFGGGSDDFGDLASPSSVSVDSRCNVYVAERGNGRTQMFAGDGAFLEVMSLALAPEGIAVSSFMGQGGVEGGVFIARTGSDDVQRLTYIDYDTDGDLLIDTDGDGLPDLWEEEGIDLDQDGTPELELPGANSRRKTLYVEVDFTGGLMAEPAPETPDAENAFDLVVNAFADAPVANPDGSTGIDLIVELGDNLANDGELVAFDVDEQTIADFPDVDFIFDNIKREGFGTAAQRAAANAEDVLAAKRLAYRYALIVRSICGEGDFEGGLPTCTGPAPFGGIAEIVGDDFIVARKSIAGAKRQAGTFMHELGHNLGLRHGGDVDTNCKPNYLSIMNYMFKPWIPNADPSLPYKGRLDYSAEALAPLDEDALNENAGIGLDPMGPDGNGTDFTFWSNDGTTIDTERGDRPIDWNGDGAIDDPVAANINGFPADGCEGGAGTDLTGHDDWANLTYGFRSSPNFGIGARVEITNEELHDEDYLAIAEFWESYLSARYTYSAKFLCVPEVGPEGEALSPGRYRTVINLHNPHDEAVRFRKKAVIARVEGEERGEISELEDDELGADEAMSITCASIAARFPGGAPVGDGFVVLKSNELLDVTAVYTSRDGLDVETVVPTDAREEEDEPGDDDTLDDDRERPDLNIELPERTRVTCPEGQGSCVHTVTVAVENLSAEDVADPFDVRVDLNMSLTATETINELGAGDSTVLQIEVGPGIDCYAPNCVTRAEVDPDDEVEETDETNNIAERQDLG